MITMMTITDGVNNSKESMLTSNNIQKQDGTLFDYALSITNKQHLMILLYKFSYKYVL